LGLNDAHFFRTKPKTKKIITFAVSINVSLMSDQPNNNFSTYKPSELIAIFSAALGRQNEFAKLVNLRGIYQQRQNNPNWSYAYAGLHDESSPSMPIFM